MCRSSWRLAPWMAAAAVLAWSGTVFAATTGTGQGTGLRATASVAGVGLGVPLGDTGLRTAPADFNNSQSTVDAQVTAGSLLNVTAGVVSGATQSALALNQVSSTGGVTNLNLSLVNADIIPLSLLKVTADAVSSNATVVCSGGSPVATGSTTITNLKVTGPLGLNVPVTINPTGPTVVNVAGVATLTINEQTAIPSGLVVNALHLEINVLNINADVVIGHSRASMPDCAAAAGSVTISVPNINASNQGAVPVQGLCTYGGGTVTITSDPAIAPVTAACTPAGTYSVNANATSLANGNVTFTATQDTATASTTVTKATTARLPTVTVDTPATPISYANQGSYGPITGTCSETGQPVAVKVGTVDVPGVSCLASGTWTTGPTPLNLTTLPDGPVLITASQTDINGRTGSGSATVNKDATPPVVTIVTAPAINATNAGSYTTSGGCTTGDSNVNVSFNGGVATAASCTGGHWTLSGANLSTLPDGTVNILATQSDAFTNTSSASRAVPKDTTPPVVTVMAPATIDASNQANYTVSGTCTTGDGQVSVNIGSFATVAPCAGGNWTVTGANVGGLPQGAVTITASQTDAAGNTGTGTGSTNKTTAGNGDTTPPTVTVVAPPIGPSNQGSYSPSGTCTAGDGPVTVTIGSPPHQVTVTATCSGQGTWTAPPSDVSHLPQGQVIVTGTQTDAAGNTGTGSATTTKSTPGAVAVPVPVGGLWAALALLATGVLGLRRRRQAAA
ncbi:choice-of-anchor P family protein [Ottowia flava]